MNRSFPRTITQLRKEKNITQKQVAKDLDISQALLSHYEKGIRECSLDFLIKISDYYDVSTDYILGRTTQRYNELTDNNDDLSENRKSTLSQIINKRLIINTITVLYEYLIKIGSKKLSSSVSNYLMLAVYKMFRLISSSNPDNPVSLFDVNKSIFKGFTSASMQILSSKIDASTNAEYRDEYIESCKNIKISQNILIDEYPDLSESVFNLIDSAESTLKSTIKNI